MNAPGFPRGPWVVFGLIAVFYAVGLGGHLVEATLPWMLALTPWFLLASGGAVVALVVPQDRWTAVALWAAPTYLVTFALEALGVATGLVFGAYHYSDVLGSLVLEVPPVIGANWVLVVWGAHSALVVLAPKLPEAVRVFAVGLVCVAFDLVLEPVAIGLGYWVWVGGEVPLQNYLAWGLIAAAGSWWAHRFPLLPTSPVLGAYVVLQAAFFAGLILGGAG